MDIGLFVITSTPNGGWNDFYGAFATTEQAKDYLKAIDVEYVSAQIVEFSTQTILWVGHL